MGITVKARVLLELGAELISSDQIAIYELVKNSLDARATRIDVDVHVTLQRSDYLTVRQSLEKMAERKSRPTADAVRQMLEPVVDLTAPKADREPKSAKSTKTSTTLSFTSDFGEYLLRKLDKAKLGDAQASSQGGILTDNIKVGSVQRLTLSAGNGDQGLDQTVRKAEMKKPKGTIHVVFDKSVPETVKAQPIVLLLTAYGEENLVG